MIKIMMIRIVATQEGRRKKNNFNNQLFTVCFDTGRYVTCVDPPPRSRTPTVEDELLTYSATNHCIIIQTIFTKNPQERLGWDPLQRYISVLKPLTSVIVRFKITKSEYCWDSIGTELSTHRQLKLYAFLTAFLQLRYELSVKSMRSLRGLCEVYEAHRQSPFKKDHVATSWHVVMLRADLDHQRICLWGQYQPHWQIRASGVYFKVIWNNLKFIFKPVKNLLKLKFKLFKY